MNTTISQAATLLSAKGLQILRALPWTPGAKETRYEVRNAAGVVQVMTVAEIRKII